MFTYYVNKRRHITSYDLYSLLHVTASVWVKRNERHQESGIEEKEDLHLRATRRSFPTKDPPIAHCQLATAGLRATRIDRRFR